MRIFAIGIWVVGRARYVMVVAILMAIYCQVHTVLPIPTVFARSVETCYAGAMHASRVVVPPSNQFPSRAEPEAQALLVISHALSYS